MVSVACRRVICLIKAEIPLRSRLHDIFQLRFTAKVHATHMMRMGYILLE